jgi:amino acid adenylation domain-containing protein
MSVSGSFFEQKWGRASSFLPVHRLIERNCELYPDREAVRYNDEALSYNLFNRYSDILACHLRTLDVGPGSRVGLISSPDLFLPVAIFGILKTGAAYVPILPSFPQKRIDYLLEDAGIDILITEEGNAPSGVKSISLRRLLAAPVTCKANTPSCESAGDAAAYILYTSGSTGNPKGVVVEQHSLYYYLHWHCLEFKEDLHDADLPLSSSMCFAAGVTQFYTPLLLGRTLHIFDEETIRQPKAFFEWYKRHPGYGIYCVPTLWEELVFYAERQKACGQPIVGPKCVLLSGETLKSSLADRTFTVFAGIFIWNLFGPTEATANITFSRVLPGKTISLGNPLPGTTVYLFDENLEPVLRGEEGELCVSGPGLARGYLNQPELTNEKFIIHPFLGKNVERMYRTGDLAGYNRAGDLILTGRKDTQIKLHGYRIEAKEIELQLERHEHIRKALVAQVETDFFNTELAAWIRFEKDSYLSTTALRRYLSEYLPPYMIPNRFVVMESFDKLPNGKIDWKKLPAPGNTRPDLEQAFSAPGNALERKIAQILKFALRFEEIGMDDNLFDLGLNSLKIISVRRELERSFGVTLAYRELLMCGTCRLLADKVAFAATIDVDRRTTGTVSIPEALSKTPCSLTPSQKSLWFIMETAPEATAYNLLFSIRFMGALEMERLRWSMEQLIRRHESFRIQCVVGNGEPAMLANDQAAPVIEMEDLRNIEASLRPGVAQQKAEELCRNIRFRPEAYPLFVCRLFKIDDNCHTLYVVIHHLIFDGISIKVFYDDLVTFYNGYGNTTFVAPDPVPGFRSYALLKTSGRSAQGLNSSIHTEGQKFWTEQLRDAPLFLDFPTDFPRPEVRRYKGAYKSFRIGGSNLVQLTSFNKQHCCTSYITLLSVLKVILYKYTHQEDILVGCPVVNREESGTNEMIGYFSNTIVLRSSITGQDSFHTVLGRVKATCMAALEYQSFPFENLLDMLRPSGNLGFTPVFQVMCAYHGLLPRGKVTAGLFAEAAEYPGGGSKFDICLDIYEKEDGLDLCLTYDIDLYSATTMEQLIDRYCHLLGTILNEPDKPIHQYLLEPEDKTAARLATWNASSAEPFVPLDIFALFHLQAIETPSSLALQYKDESLTYAGLGSRADLMAAYFASKGISKGAWVGVLMNNGPDLVTTLIALLKLGAAYVPLDPHYPREHLTHIVLDSGVRWIVTQPEWKDIMTGLPVEFILAKDAGKPGTSPEAIVEVGLDDIAYVMYTSGSTGKPKGVMVPQRGVSNYLQWMKRRFTAEADTKILNKTSINFDLSVWEIFLPLISGSVLVLADQEQSGDPEELAKLIRRYKVTDVQFVPPLLRTFVASTALSSCPSIRRIFSAGEALSKKLCEDILVNPGIGLHNLYGPTEASICVCHWPCANSDSLNLIPIGKPIDNAFLVILDDNMKPVPPGIAGEIHIGGIPLAVGYHQMPELTAAKFVSNPVPTIGCERLLKTGDWGRYGADGSIDYLGRRDRQTKIRGHRVELGEIEHKLAEHPDVTQAAVSVQEYKEDTQIIAYVVSREKQVLGDTDLRAYLRGKLPKHMIPFGFVQLSSIPLLPNNKVNYKVLPPFERRLVSGAQQHWTDDGRALCGIWEEVLGKGGFTLDDNFFDVGGHSLLVPRLASLISRLMNRPVTNIDVFQFPTIRAQVARFLGADPGNDIRAGVRMRNQQRKAFFNEHKLR